MPSPISIQLYTVRNLIEKNGYKPVIQQIADAGYVGVETAGVPQGTTPADFAKFLKDLGLQVSSGHYPLPVGDKEKEVIETATALGCKRLIGGFWENEFKTAAAIKETAAKFNAAAKACAKHGMTWGVHNHWWEFLKVEGRYAYEILLDHCDPALFLEVDIYWAQTAGADPAAELKKIGKRAPVLHIKDGPCVIGQPMTAVGDGKVNVPAAIKAAGSNAEWLIIELDECATDMMEAVRKSYRYLTTQGLARGKQ